MTQQSDRWGDDFGEEYTRRNPSTPDEMEALYRERFGVSRTAMNAEFLGGLARDLRVLEVGCNVGTQLNLLARAGFEDLSGVEVNPFAIERSHELNRGLPVNVIRGSALELPYRDEWFDLVYTSGVLIHIHPDNIETVMREIVRCTKRWVWGFEYYAEVGYVEIPYRGEHNMLWKTDFARHYLATVPQLDLVREEFYHYNEDATLVDQMFLLQKMG